MKVAPTLNGGLRIDAEGPSDWRILRSIVPDARWGDMDLAERLGGLIDDEQAADDWRDFVVPGLRDGFDDQLGTVEEAIESAAEQGDGAVGSIEIGRADAPLWYGALNQARLAIEEAHGFGSSEAEPPPIEDPLRRSAFFRSHFYMAIQGMLLEHVLPFP